MKQRLWLFSVIGLGLLALITVFPAVGQVRADQFDATAQQQTINAIVVPRLTWTAQSVFNQTATALNQAAMTGAALQTVTALAQTISLTPSSTATMTNTTLATPTPVYTATFDATLQFQTIIAAANGILTLTPQMETAAAGTANFQGTVNSILVQTLGYTLTPTATPSPLPTIQVPGGPTSLDATAQFQTVIAVANSLLAQTLQAQTAIAGTAYFQATVNHVLAQTLGYTATPIITPTLNPLEAQQTIGAVVNQSLTDTPRAQLTASVTAAVSGTLNAILHNDLMETATSVRATLVHGLRPIAPTTAGAIVTLAELKGQTDSIQGVAFSADGALIASASLDGTVFVWDTSAGELLRVFNGLTGRLAVTFSPDGSRLVAAAADGTLRVWDLRTNAELPALKGHLKAVNSVAFSADGRLIASGSDDKTVRLWDAQSGNATVVLNDAHSPIAAVAFSPDGTRVAAVGSDTTLTIWEVSTGLPLVAIRSGQVLSSLRFYPNETNIAIGGSAGQIQIRNVKDGSVLGVLNGQGSAISTLAISPDGFVLASGSRGGTIWLWNAETGAKLAALSGHPGGVNSLAFSPDGTRLISGGKDNVVRIWGVPAS